MKHIPNSRLHHFSCQLWHPSNNPPPPPLPVTTVSAYDLAGGQAHSPQGWLSVWRWVKSPLLCSRVLDQAGCPLSQIKGASSGTVAEPTASGATHYYMRRGTCDLFNYSALHFYPTIQNATWELIALKIHLYNLPQAHKLSNFWAGWTSHAGTSRSLSELGGGTSLQCVGGSQTEWGCSFARWKTTGRKKKYTCYLVNPQTCKIGISWMSATEMELTRDLFIVTEGH